MRYFPLSVCLLLMLQGCTVYKPSWHLSTAELKSIRALQVAQYQSPGLRKQTVAADMVGFLGKAIDIGIGSTVQIGIETSGAKRLAEASALPDFGRSVVEGFAEELRKNFSGLPEPMVLQTIVDDEYKPSDSAHLITIQLAEISIEFHGLKTYTIGKMLSPKGTVIWEKGYVYRTSDFSKHSQEEFETDNGKLLRQEMAHARDVTVSELIRHLKGLPSAVKRPAIEWEAPKEPAKK